MTPPPPAAPVISTGVANSNESVTLTGTAPDGSTVTVSDGGKTALGTATASSTGAWSFTTADLSAGAYAFTATDTTSAGTSAASSAFDVTVTPPDSPAVSSVKESPASGDLDAGKTVTLTLTLNEAVTVNGTPTLTLNDGGTATYTTGTGTDALTFSYTVGAGQNASALAVTSVNLPNGATITNSTGQNASLNLTDLTQTGPQIDTTAPNAPVISSDTINTDVVTLAGTAAADSTVTVYNGTAELGTAAVNSGGGWTYTTGALASGNYAFTATATDPAGNVSALSSPLDVAVNAPANLVTNGSFETDNFTGWTLGGNYTSTTYGPEIFITPDAESGQYAAALGSMNSDGTLSQTLQTTAGQQYTVSFWLANEGAGPNNFTASWNGAALTTLTNAPAQNYTEYSFTVTATGSTSTLEFAAEQNPSQWDLDNVSVTIDAAAPPPPVITTDPKEGRHITLAGTAEDDSTVTVYDNGMELGTTTANATGAWTFTTGKLSRGSQVFTATDTDAAGNTSALSSPVDPIIGGGALENAVQSAIFARLNSYIASSFAEVHSGYGYNMVSDALQNREQSPLTNPHHA